MVNVLVCDVLCFQCACFCLVRLCGLVVIDGVVLYDLVLCLLLFVLVFCSCRLLSVCS